MIAGMTAIIGSFITFLFWLGWHYNMKARSLEAERDQKELQMKADKQAHEQYMELQELQQPPSAELLRTRQIEAEAVKAQAEAERAREIRRRERNPY